MTGLRLALKKISYDSKEATIALAIEVHHSIEIENSTVDRHNGGKLIR
jgi:hypothetical protein